MAVYDLSYVPPVLEDLLDASDRLRAFAVEGSLPEGSVLGRRIWALADLVEHQTIHSKPLSIQAQANAGAE